MTNIDPIKKYIEGFVVWVFFFPKLISQLALQSPTANSMFNFKAIPAVVSLSRLGITICHLTKAYLGTVLSFSLSFHGIAQFKIFTVLTGRKREAIFFMMKFENWDLY